MLGCEDDHETMEASERDQQASKRDQQASKRDQQASKWDQNGILAWDQNHENVCVVSATQDQNNEKARDGSMAWDQNNDNVHEGNMHFGGTKEKQMTYHEALLGLDNSELSSNF